MSRVTRFLPLVALAGVVAIAIAIMSGGDDKYVVYAKFADAGGILKNYNVKIGGVPAGKVGKITLGKNDEVTVKFDLDKGAAPIGQGASATVRPVNLLGEKYIDLNPGDLNKPMPSGSVIPESSTSIPVEIDDALNILEPDTRTAMKILINEAGISMAGRGSDFNQMLTELPPALDSARKVVQEIADENTQLRNAVVKGDRVVGQLSSKSDNLTDFVDSAGRALKAAADRRAKLGETVQTAPAALARLRSTLGQLQSASLQLRPAANDLRQTTPSLAQTLQRVPSFAKDAQSTLDEATKVAPTLNKLAVRSTPTLRELRPTTKNLADFSSNSKQLTDWLADKGAFGKFLEFMSAWAGVTEDKDGVSHVFRLRATADEELLTSVLQKYAGLPSDKTGPRPTEQDPNAQNTGTPPPATDTRTPQENKPALKLPKVKDLVPGPLGEGLQKTLDNVGTAVDGIVGSLTGQTAGDRDSTGDTKKLLNYLLGP